MGEAYKTIVIDPPWPGPGATRDFTKGKQILIPYQTMGGVEIAGLRIPAIAAIDAQLWIWATSREVADAYLLAQAWGFEYRALFIWAKPGLGTGRHFRTQAEFLLWAARPNAKIVRPKDCPRQVQQWPKPRAHSAKPAEAYEFIADLSDAPRIDIFSRQTRPGFDAWGNEVGLLDE